MSEGIAMAMILAVGDVVIQLGWVIGIVVAFAVLWKFVARPYVRIERTRILLDCSKADARVIADYIDEIGVPWITLHQWTYAAMNVYMPMVMFGNQQQDRMIATWCESREAVTKLALEKKMKAGWTKDDALGAVALEILKRRQSEGRGLFMPNSEPTSLAK